MRNHVYEYTDRMFASLPRQKAEIHKQILNRTWRWWQAMAPNPLSLPCTLAFPLPSHRDATTPSPCWAPHFMTQNRIMFSNPTPSEPRLSPAATMSDDMLSALTLPLHCASILQPATPPRVFAFESWTISAPICLNRFTFAESRKPDLWTCVCVFTFFSSDFVFLIKMNFSFKSLFAIWRYHGTKAVPLDVQDVY